MLLSVAVTLFGASAGTRVAAQDLGRERLAANVSNGQAQAHCVASSAAGGAASAPQALHHAGLVIVFPEGRTETFCIEFAADEISGAELLQRSGLPVVVSSFGGLGAGVCRIDTTGCSDPGDCFCQCQGGGCAYWSYFALEGGVWRFQGVGPSQHRLRDGDVDGWVWGSGRTAPGQVGANGPCPAAVVSPTPTARPPEQGRERPTAVSDAGATRTDARSGGSTPSPEQSNVPTAAAPAMAGSTPQGEVRRVPIDRGASQGGANGTSGVGEQGGGPPAGLIAFGAVAALLIMGVGGLALRRRLRG